jgi:hypothetical protein
MALSPEHRARMLAETKEQAAALFDDIQYLRAISVHPEQSPADLRRASGVLRRLLVERDIANVAAPRIGRILFSAPDNNPFYEAAENAPFTFFASGGMEVLGVRFRTAIVDFNSSPRPQLARVNPDATVQLRLDGFLSQRVLCLNGQWVGRGDVIKHIANVAHGVHSGTATTAVDETISRIRKTVWYSKAEPPGGLSITFDIHSLQRIAEPVFHYSTNAIDPALLELLSTVSYLLKSEDVVRLEALIHEELP